MPRTDSGGNVDAHLQNKGCPVVILKRIRMGAERDIHPRADPFVHFDGLVRKEAERRTGRTVYPALLVMVYVIVEYDPLTCKKVFERGSD